MTKPIIGIIIITTLIFAGGILYSTTAFTATLNCDSSSCLSIGEGISTIGARVFNSANQTITTSTTTAITFDSERYDTDSIHSTVSNTSRLTTNTTGKYLIIGNIQWATNATGTRSIRILLNGATIIGQFNIPVNSAAEATIQVVSTIYSLVATDYVELVVVQNSGGNLNVVALANQSPEFMMTKIQQ